MAHLFEEDIAVEYGVNAAIIIQNIYYWVEKNRLNEKNFYDGKYWTYNSVRAYAEMFPYMSGKSIRNTLNKLEEEGLVVTGNYNDTSYDRTKWYALTEKGYALFEKKDKSILPKGKMESAKKENENAQKGKPIPDNNTNNKPDIDITSDDVICPEAETSSSPGPEEEVVSHLPLNDHTLYPVTQKQVDKWTELYPSVDVMQELRNMIGWLDADSKRLKTKRGIRRFINGWLAREQNRGRYRNGDSYQRRGVKYQQAGGRRYESTREQFDPSAEFGDAWEGMPEEFSGWGS